MTLREKKEELVQLLVGVGDAQQRLAWVVEKGRSQAPLPPELRTEAHLVEGCLSRLWFIPRFHEGACFFRSDSDSAIVRGIAALLCEFYSGRSPSEILEVDPSFLREVGITQHLSANRRNALGRLWEKIREFAQSNEPNPPPPDDLL